MDKKNLKVFHGLVNYGTQAGLFAQALRTEGVYALSVSHPDTFKRTIDIELLHGGNLVQKLYRHTWNWLRRIFWFFRFNTFHFYYGKTLFPRQWDLPLYKIFGKKVIMEYLGYDAQLYQKSIEKYKYTNVNFYRSPEENVRGDRRKLKRLKYETKYLDRQFVCAPYLSEFVENSEVLPLGIDISNIPYLPKNYDKVQNFKVLHAPTHRGNKGTSFIEDAINKLKEEGYNIDFTIAENIPHQKLMELYKECDIFVDQVAGGWYGTASIEAMAIGRPTICYMREDYFQYINFGNKIPIINADRVTIYDELKKVFNKAYDLEKIAEKSRLFVEEIHDVQEIAKKLEIIYLRCHSDIK